MFLLHWPLWFLFKLNKTSYASRQHQSDYESSELLPSSNFIDFESISIPNDFMDYTNNHIIRELMESSSDLLINIYETTELLPTLVSENMSSHDLISFVKNYFDKNFYSQNEKYPDEIHEVKTIINEIYNKVSELDFTIYNRTASNISDKDVRFLLSNVLKQLVFYVESNIFDNTNKNERENILDNILVKLYSCVEVMKDFMSKYDKMAIKKVSKKTSVTVASKKRFKIFTNSVKLTEHHSDDVYNSFVSLNKPLIKLCDFYKNHRLNQLYSFENPLSSSGDILVRSFCMSNEGILYVAITRKENHNFFYIFKIKPGNSNDCFTSLVEEYTLEHNFDKTKIPFKGHCKKIIINQSGIIYILKYDYKYELFLIVALDSDFFLINSFKITYVMKYGLEEPFVEDIVIYSDCLYMLDSVNKCIIVTDFEFKIKQILKVDIKLGRFKADMEINIKSKKKSICNRKFLFIFWMIKICLPAKTLLKVMPVKKSFLM